MLRGTQINYIPDKSDDIIIRFKRSYDPRSCERNFSDSLLAQSHNAIRVFFVFFRGSVHGSMIQC